MPNEDAIDMTHSTTTNANSLVNHQINLQKSQQNAPQFNLLRLICVFNGIINFMAEIKRLINSLNIQIITLIKFCLFLYNIKFQIQVSNLSLKCQVCENYYNLSSRIPFSSPCCKQHSCKDCKSFCRCYYPKLLQREQDAVKVELLNSIKNETHFICQDCGVRTVDSYCGLDQKFSCVNCIVKNCKSHANKWEELTDETFAKIAKMASELPDFSFCECIKTTGNQMLNKSEIIFDQDINKLVSNIKILHQLKDLIPNTLTKEADSQNDAAIAKQRASQQEQNEKGLGIKLDDYLKV